MRYDDDYRSSENEDSEVEAEFHDLRKRILSFQDSIAVIDPELYSNSVREFVSSTFQSVIMAPNNNWRDVEVALMELHAFAEPLKGNL
jgi:exportin-T